MKRTSTHPLAVWTEPTLTGMVLAVVTIVTMWDFVVSKHIHCGDCADWFDRTMAIRKTMAICPFCETVNKWKESDEDKRKRVKIEWQTD